MKSAIIASQPEKRWIKLSSEVVDNREGPGNGHLPDQRKRCRQILKS